MRRRVLLLDVLAVSVFVIGGRANHGESGGLLSILDTAGPFLLALVAGWLLTRAWRQPDSLPTGVAIAFTTVAGGLLLRRTAFGEGTAMSFIVVTAVILSSLLIGWRLLITLRQRRPSNIA